MSADATARDSQARISSGIEGLDEVLGGGYPAARMLLVAGAPGTGKTTLGLQFLVAGGRRGETGLYILLSETAAELRDVAASHRLPLDGIEILDLAGSEESLQADAQYTLFHPDEVELSDTTRMVLETVERVRPRRVVFDSLSEMRLLARDPLRFRRQLLALKTFLTGRDCTVLLLDIRPMESRAGDAGGQVESLAHGVIALEVHAQNYGRDRRRLRIQKLRGVAYRDGYHDFNIETGGLRVFPRLVAGDHPMQPALECLPSGVEELDQLLGGGLDGGTSTLLLGPAGCGKSTLALQYAIAAAKRGLGSAIYMFDEFPSSFFARARALGMDVESLVEAGTVDVIPVNPAELSPGEFAAAVRQAVEVRKRRVVVIDSLNGYQNAMPEERFLREHLHELNGYLNKAGVVTLLLLAQHGIVGLGVESPVELSYLADTVVLIRYFEVAGEVRQAISVVKKRTGRHERTVRELSLETGGVRVGRALTEFSGLLSGRLDYLGDDGDLLRSRAHRRP